MSSASICVQECITCKTDSRCVRYWKKMISTYDISIFWGIFSITIIRQYLCYCADIWLPWTAEVFDILHILCGQFQSRTVTEYIYLSTVLKYNFEGSVLYSSIIFGEYSWLYSSTFERQILYSLLHYISIHNREYPLLLLKKRKQ